MMEHSRCNTEIIQIAINWSIVIKFMAYYLRIIENSVNYRIILKFNFPINKNLSLSPYHYNVICDFPVIFFSIFDGFERLNVSDSNHHGW